MAIPIPPDFDYHKEQMDDYEKLVRDVFHLNVENWAQFRHTIGVYTNPERLQGSVISDELKEAYRELGKCLYEVILPLGYCNLAFLEIHFVNSFAIRKAIKDFYFHGSVLLDNLSRIIYIVNDPGAVSAKGRTGDYVRHRIDRSDLIRNYATHVRSYISHIANPRIDEFSNVRNAMAHYWGIPFDNGQWPRDQLQHKAFAWPTYEPKYETYSGWTPVPVILNDHFQELTKAQDAVFGLLVNDVEKFETNNSVTIV
jgi:hypothetical protein